VSKTKEFFEKHILPLYLNNKAGEILCLDKKFNINVDSYFSSPRHPECQYLSTIPLEDEAELKSYLQTFWKDEPALLNLIPDLVKLAFTLKLENKEQVSELSPLIYVMY
jgi:hypothetical protein